MRQSKQEDFELGSEQEPARLLGALTVMPAELLITQVLIFLDTD